VKLKIIFFAAILATFQSLAGEQELLITTDFVLKAGESEQRILTINKPAELDQLVMVGFNPIKALSVDCVLRLYAPSEQLLGTYNCAERQSYELKQLSSGTAQFKAHIEVSNYNFTAKRTSFSVINRFKFVAVPR
jgi:hypothetical protein